MTTITAQTILRSRHSQRPEKILSTLLLRYPRWIHAELMTHRVFSRNAASSRAIPVSKLLNDILENPAKPIHWGKNQRGMQAGEELAGVALAVVQDLWEQAKSTATSLAYEMTVQGAHKQVINRILEPFAHITVLVSSTEWLNFMALRDHADAEPHIAILAREIRKELDRTDNIQILEPGKWHTPFVGTDELIKINQSMDPDQVARFDEGWRRAIKMSVACCASTSYKTVDGFDMTLEKAIEIHDKLLGSSPIHASPAEHVAQAAEWYFDDGYWEDAALHGNFEGFIQYRKMLPNESL